MGAGTGEAPSPPVSAAGQAPPPGTEAAFVPAARRRREALLAAGTGSGAGADGDTSTERASAGAGSGKEATGAVTAERAAVWGDGASSSRGVGKSSQSSSPGSTTSPPHPWAARAPAAPTPRSAPPPRQVRTRSRQLSCGPARREWMDDPHGERLSVLWSVKAVPHPARTRPQKAFQGQVPLPVLSPALRPQGGKRPRHRARMQPSCWPHGDAGERS